MIRKLTAPALVLGTLLLLSANGARAAEDSRANGVVSDVSTGEPLANVVVIGRDGAGNEVKATTDKKGHFTALGLSYGQVQLSVANSAYNVEQVTCYVPAGEGLTFEFDVAKLAGDAVPHSRCRLEPNSSTRYIVAPGSHA